MTYPVGILFLVGILFISCRDVASQNELNIDIVTYYMKHVHNVGKVYILILFQMLETECYKELNLWAPDGGPSLDLIEDQPPPQPRRGFFDRVFRRRRVSHAFVAWQSPFPSSGMLVKNTIMLIWTVEFGFISIHLHRKLDLLD